MNINQNTRIDNANNKILLGLLLKNFPKNKYKYYFGNYGYVLVSKDSDFIIKFYINSDSYNKELKNYEIVKSLGIPIPKLIGYGDFNLFKNISLRYIKIENIRKISSRKEDFNLINVDKLSDLISKIHGLKLNNQYYIHGNLHPSNFFFDENSNLGIFDLVSMQYGKIESDIADIYINSGLSDYYLDLFLKNYKYSSLFNFENMINMAISKINNNLSAQYIGEEDMRQNQNTLKILKNKI